MIVGLAPPVVSMKGNLLGLKAADAYKIQFMVHPTMLLFHLFGFKAGLIMALPFFVQLQLIPSSAKSTITSAILTATSTNL